MTCSCHGAPKLRAIPQIPPQSGTRRVGFRGETRGQRQKPKHFDGGVKHVRSKKKDLIISLTNAGVSPAGRSSSHANTRRTTTTGPDWQGAAMRWTYRGATIKGAGLSTFIMLMHANIWIFGLFFFCCLSLNTHFRSREITSAASKNNSWARRRKYKQVS